MFKNAALGLAALLCFTPMAMRAEDSDHLVPTSSIYAAPFGKDDYPRILQTVFPEAYGKDVRARVYITAAGPGPTLANMVFLREQKGRYRIVALHSDAPLWMYRSGLTVFLGKARYHLDPPDYHAIKPVRCELAIPHDLGARITGVWEKMLLQTAYQRTLDRGADGADYLFSMETQEEGSLVGTTWSWYDRPKIGNLMVIAGTMEHLCQKSPDAKFSDLVSTVGSLEKLLH